MEREAKILNPMGLILDSLEKGVGQFHIPKALGNITTGRSKGNAVPPHLHPYPEIFIQLRESTIFSFNEGEYYLDQGSMALVPPMTFHPERVGGQREKFLNLVILAAPGHVNCHLARAENGIPRVNESIMRKTRRGEQIIALERIIIDLYRQGEVKLIPPLLKTIYYYLRALFIGDENRVTALSDKVMRACSIIGIEIANPLLNGKFLAQRLGCSRDYLSHIFHREMNERLSAYISRERIQRAKTLLTNTELNCSETAWACGFSQAAYFNRIFKEQTGFTPREYKKRT